MTAASRAAWLPLALAEEEKGAFPRDVGQVGGASDGLPAWTGVVVLCPLSVSHPA